MTQNNSKDEQEYSSRFPASDKTNEAMKELGKAIEEWEPPTGSEGSTLSRIEALEKQVDALERIVDFLGDRLVFGDERK